MALAVARPEGGFRSGLLEGVAAAVEAVDLPAVGVMAVLLLGDRLGHLLAQRGVGDARTRPSALPAETTIRDVELVLSTVVVPAVLARFLLADPARLVAGFVLLVLLPVLVGLTLVHGAYVGVNARWSPSLPASLTAPWEVLAAAGLLSTVGLGVVAWAAGARAGALWLVPVVVLVFGPLVGTAAVGRLVEVVRTARRESVRAAVGAGTAVEFLSGLLVLGGVGLLLYGVAALLAGPRVQGDILYLWPPGAFVMIVVGFVGMSAALVGRWGREHA